MTETVTRIVARGAFWSSASTVITKIFGAVSMILILRSLSVYEYGVVELIMSIPALLSIFTLPGLSSVVIADMGEARGRADLSEMRRLFTSYIRLIFLFSLIPVVFTLTVTSFFMESYDPSIRHMIQIVSILFPITAFTTGASILFRVFLKFKWAAWSSSIYEISKLVLIVSLFYFWEANPLTVVLSSVGADLFALALMSPKTLSLYRAFAHAPLRQKLEPLSLLYNHGKWGVASTYIGSLNQYIRPWIIKVTIGTEAVGLFAAAQGLLQHTFSLMPLANLIQPMLPQYMHDKEHYYRIIRKFIKYQFLSASTMAVLGLVLFPPILAIMFPKYIEAFGVYQALLLAFGAYALAPVVAGIFYALKQQKSLTLAYTKRLLLTAVLCPVFALWLGVWGVVLEFIITLYIFQIDRWLLMKKLMPDFVLKPRSLITYDEYDDLLVKKFLEKMRIR